MYSITLCTLWIYQERHTEDQSYSKGWNAILITANRIRASCMRAADGIGVEGMRKRFDHRAKAMEKE